MCIVGSMLVFEDGKDLGAITAFTEARMGRRHARARTINSSVLQCRHVESAMRLEPRRRAPVCPCEPTVLALRGSPPDRIPYSVLHVEFYRTVINLVESGNDRA